MFSIIMIYDSNYDFLIVSGPLSVNSLLSWYHDLWEDNNCNLHFYILYASWIFGIFASYSLWFYVYNEE